MPLVALLVLPWFVWADRYTDGELTRVFLWRHNFARGFDEAGGLRAHPWWFYGPQFLLDFLPWSPLVLVAGWVAVRRGDWRTDSELRLGLIWFLVMFGLLSCVRFKRADYLLPAFPGAALLVGCAAERLYHTSVQSRRLAFGFAAVLVACLLAWGGYVDVVLPAQEAGREYTRFATAIRQVAPAPQPVLFFRTESHTLAFHVGRPLHVLVQWDDLERWTHQDSGFVVIPRRVVEELTAFPWAHRLEEVLDNVRLAGGRHEKPLVLFRLRPSRDDNPHDRSTPTAANPPRTDQRDPPGAE